ncbi:echinoderm microtubule-associated protein-like 1 [Elysia marginata]|uniref:Echinoderm microtubule-associated protein-like 1 n=1 Tax=Elysia marginata TaxID=1093978 RepID=A0AAV4I2N0_9GAST|nr:echinoderm microtubule-associated protein-like 1 [Elysia marginata]
MTRTGYLFCGRALNCDHIQHELMSPCSLAPNLVANNGLLSHDKDDVVERVAYLEKKLQAQEDEIVCLKSAMADVIRRLASVEQSSHSNGAPSRSQARQSLNRPRSSMGLAGHTSSSGASRNHMSAMDNVNVMSQRHAPVLNAAASRGSKPGRPSSAHHQSMAKWSSLATAGEMSNTNLTPTSSKDPQWNQDDGCLKIYIRGRAINMYGPSDLGDYNISKQADPPSEKLQLEWVYGYRGRDCRSNLYHLPTGEIVYFTAGVVVLHNIQEQSQRHYTGHTDDIKCLAIHPDKLKIATGQVAGHDSKEGKRRPGQASSAPCADDGSPHVRIWESVSLNTLHVIGLGVFNRAVCCVSFSKLDGGQHLVVVDESNEHILSVWDVGRDKPVKLADTKSSTEPVLAVEYHPLEKNQIVSCGKSQISFWTFEGGSLAKKNGIFDVSY